MDTEKWTDSAAFAAGNPPACANELSLTLLDPAPADRPSSFVAFSVSCGTCGSGDLRIRAFPMLAPDPSPYSGIAPGEPIYRPPHRLECAACGQIAKLFDPGKDGYDGALGHGSNYELGESGETAVPDAAASFAVKVTFGYGIDLEELREIADEEDLSPADLFDFIEIYGTSSGGQSNFSLDYECA